MTALTPAIAYQVRQPPPHLAEFIESYWSVTCISDIPKNVVVMPDGRVDLHFFSSPHEPYHAALAGLECELSPVTVMPGSRLTSVSFKLLAMEYVLGSSVAHLLDDRMLVDPAEWGICMADAADFDVFCGKLNDKISSLVKPGVDERKRRMFDLIYSSKGSATVADIADAAQWSSRQINRYFNQWFGMSLKAYCSILRFRASLVQIKEGKFYPEDFYFDQAHFIKDIKKYSGMTPKELHKNRDDRFIQLLALKKP
ncbi:DUF6597 domain-containing transcriptional factor [Undibacterium sp. TS12]|uniref:helix-turn-helix domain-containing protein n=1 Tax=Undibacterium sp. TS12 TaxID=2908202 RepID=UPI001F4D31F2|nr:DUF6597 domain-containing transcriptional factor [Undibacterium sp. TS12]MCH8620504.1 hypothetical protein [Undibacterium sp. TS12]